MKFSIPEMKMEERYSHNMSACNCSKQNKNMCGIMEKVGC